MTALLSTRLGRDVGALAAGEAVNKAARFAAAVVLARALPLDEFGLLNVGIALGGLAVVALRLGLPDLGAREVAARPAAAAELAGRVVAPQVAGMTALIALAGIVTALVEPGAALFAVMAGVSMLGLSASADWLLRGQGRMGAVASATALGGIVVLVAALVVAALSDAATAALAGFAVGELVVAAATWRASGIARRTRPTLRGASALIRRAWPLAASGLVLYAFTANVDTLLLAALRSAEEAGLYSGPYRLFLALTAVGVFAGQALLPAATRASDAGRARLGAALPLLLAYGLLCLGVAEIAGGPLLEALFGSAFGSAEPVLVILVAAVPWYAVGFPAGYVLIAADRSRAFLTGAAAAAALNLVLNLALIPPFGPEGAAAATLAAFVLAAVVWLSRQGLLRAVAPLVALASAATAGAIVVVLADGGGVAAGALTLVAATVLTTQRQ